ncbi:exported protein of unknown function [Candidatus Filomicrobium marinum]|uniref:Secreted protein n=1 Tax=Candidatus Filomicrobium marinum TaxID=1608628 RepID=A0A0D6JB02_9HYPH|nr:exported protein of unknown function [Candidatus Filomicrobium marinum]CPR16108.1 exported protein of unknown function [Candidatus Filomicrobium marinum]
MMLRFASTLLAVAVLTSGALAQSSSPKPEEVHPPTGRIGSEVPKMTTEEAETKSKPQNGQRKESVHPPTGRIGTEVPKMTTEEGETKPRN